MSCAARPGRTRPRAPTARARAPRGRSRPGCPRPRPPGRPPRRLARDGKHRRPAGRPGRRPARPTPSPPHRPRRPRRRRRAGRLPGRTTITVTDRSRRTPLVVVVLRAKRTSAWLLSSTSTMQPSAPRRRAAASASLDQLLRRQSRPHRHRPASSRALSTRTPRDQDRGAPVANRRHLARLTLAAVERTAQHPGRRAADGLHGAPEVGRRGLIRHVLDLPGQLPPSIR